MASIPAVPPRGAPRFRWTRWILAVFAAGLCSIGAHAADASASESAAPDSAAEGTARPRIALVLAGGGARGAAHVGVLKVLEELHVPVDCIAGTSMGALVGGGYAAGLPAHEVEQLVRGLDWKAVIGGVGTRALQPAEQKRLNDASGSLELGYRDGRILSSTGVIATSGIEDVLRRYVARARTTQNFDRLPIPFRAVAIDYLSGDLAVLGDGDLATAMRASMAIPGVFAPVDTRGRLLGDGGGLRNLPVDVGRELCGEVVIAVNLVKPPVTRAQLAGPLQLLRRNMDVMGQTSERQQLKSLTDADVRIDVDLGDMAVQDFQRTAEAIDVGEAAARAMAKELARLAVPASEYSAWRERVTRPQDVRVEVADVRFEGVERVNPAFLQTVARIAPGDVVDSNDLARAAARMSALDELDGVGYELRGDPTRPTLVWQPAERIVGHDVFRPSLGLYGASEGDQRFELALQHVRRWVNPRGAQWRNDVMLGSTTLLRTSFYQPADVAQRFFVEPAVLGRISLEDVYLDGERIARFRYLDAGGRLDVGANFGPIGQVRAGYWIDRRRIEWDIGLRLLPDETFTDAGWRAEATWDSRDASTFASRGLAAAVQVLASNDGLGGERDWRRLEAAMRRTFTIGDAVVSATGAAGWRLDDALPGDRLFSLGGPQSFPGLAPGELRVGRYWTAAADVRWPLAELVSLANESLYVGAGTQVTGAYERLDGLDDDRLYGGSVFLGGRTPIGTLTFGGGVATDSWTVWLTLGKAIGTGSILNEPLFR